MCFSNFIITHCVYKLNHVSFFGDLFESILDYRKIVLLFFPIKNDVDFLHECGFPKNDINHLCFEIENRLMGQNDEYLEYIKNEKNLW